MDLVRKIHEAPNAEAQRPTPQVRNLSISRMQSMYSAGTVCFHLLLHARVIANGTRTAGL